MSIRRSALAALVAAGLVAGSATIAGATADATANRLAGPDRYVTARVIAEQTFRTADAAILVSGRSFADALSAAFLSGATGSPLLLTDPGSLPPGVDDTLKALGVDGIQVIGGTAAVSDHVIGQLRDLGYVVDRLAGADRFETARKVAELLPPETVGHFGAGRAAILATGATFPDALAASPLSSSQGMPILLTEAGSLNAHARAALESNRIRQVLLVGGTAAVSEAVVTQLEAMGIEVRRIAGSTRQATAAALAVVAEEELGYPTTRVLLARGDGFADALAGGTRGGRLFAPILLTHSRDVLGSDARAFIAANTETIEVVDVLGGKAAVGDAAANAAVAAARGQ